MCIRKWFALAFALALSSPGVVAAQSVLVVEARGVPGKAGAEFAKVAKSELRPMRVKVSKSKVPGGSKRLGALADLASKGRHDYVVDLEGSSKKLFVMVVGANGEVVYDKTFSLPKSKSKHKGAVADAARAAAKALKSRAAPPAEEERQPVAATGEREDSSGGGSSGASSSPAGSDPFASAAAAPWSGGGSSSSGGSGGDDGPREDTGRNAVAVKDDAGDDEDKRVTATAPRKSRRPNDGGFGIAIAVGGGGGGYTETVNSKNNPGDRDINVSMSPELGGSLGLQVSRDLRVDVRAARQSATLKPDVASSQSEIKAGRLSVGGQASYIVVDGEWPIAAMLGFGFESSTTNEQPEILWIPEHSAWDVVLGATFSNGDLSTEGLTTEIAAGLIPYGSHSRKADALTVTSRALGGQAHVRLRFQFPELLGDSMGLFVEGLGSARYLMLSPGNSPQPTGTTTRDQALPLGDVDSSRLDYGAFLSVGIAIRP